ncbi:deoxynucleotide monophosphate kinase [Mesorhizobium sp. B2-2-1]|uniref:deoxynucleotide monophosphate kinase n=1 Tax=Mesorhizobium sp. B2-2-1 TaxID=2589965 RepID=UPI00112C5635|nr:deoxynucleotide monophosphate kinase [Mesorhizobium sp. B2-2-1]TPM67434.1 deoxynucleotide monophosphate kinase [Mesorhizobium sp. B2-2-1]
MTAAAELWTPFGHMPANDNRLPSAVNEALPLVVALSGLAGSGKSTAAQYLVERHGYTRVRFAGPLKAMIKAIGLDDRHTDGEWKEETVRLLNHKTPRHAMQTLGTEWGRKCMGEDFWVNLWSCAASDVIEDGGRVVVDDCRFPNEAAAVRKMGGDIYRLAGRGGIAGAHESERMDFLADVHIDNSGTVADLRRALVEAMGRYA